MNDYYDFSIDIWSVGCIFAELLTMMRSNFADFLDRQPLFPGKSCYKLSPVFGKEQDKEKKLRGDQLNVIFDVIGTPKEDEDLSDFIDLPESIEYVQQFPKRERRDLSVLYPGTENKGVQLLYRMLEFNPKKRITAEEAIADSYFDDIRLPEQETFEVPHIYLPMDDEEEDDLDLKEVKVQICK